MSLTLTEIKEVFQTVTSSKDLIQCFEKIGWKVKKGKALIAGTTYEHHRYVARYKKSPAKIEFYVGNTYSPNGVDLKVKTPNGGYAIERTVNYTSTYDLIIDAINTNEVAKISKENMPKAITLKASKKDIKINHNGYNYVASNHILKSIHPMGIYGIEGNKLIADKVYDPSEIPWIMLEINSCFGSDLVITDGEKAYPVRTSYSAKKLETIYRLDYRPIEVLNMLTVSDLNLFNAAIEMALGVK